MLRIVGCELASEGRPTSASGSKAALMARRPIYPPQKRTQVGHRGHFRNGPNKRHHSITSSARPSSIAGISRPSAFAVLRLMTSANLVGW